VGPTASALWLAATISRARARGVDVALDVAGSGVLPELVQLACRQGYEPDEHDYDDVVALAAIRGIHPPSPFDG